VTNTIEQHTLKNISNCKFKKLDIEYKAGRKFNYDFTVYYLNQNNDIINEINIEFKFNCKKITNYPQFLSVSSKHFIKGLEYAEYFYDNYLTDVLDLIDVDEIPTKKEYMKFIHQIDYNKLDIFKELYDNETKIKDLKKKIVNYRRLVTEIVSEKFNKTLYPEFTHLVLWRTGRQMARHKDDGYELNDPLAARKVSCVTYLNDNFTGGETFVTNETGTDYISKPVKGSFACYLSDSTNEHGVNPVLSGIRVTMPIWFCDDITKSEDVRLADIIKSLS